MKTPKMLVLSVAAALVSACLGGCFMGPKETMTSVVQANRYGQFAIVPGQKVAVLTFTGYKGSGLADLVTIEFLRHGVDVVERNMLDRVVAEVRRTEAGMYNADLSDLEILRQIGKITEADFVVYGDADAVDPDTLRYLRDDFGKLTPRFFLSYAQISLRAFSTKTGEVTWWGTTEATVQAPWGNEVRLMDHLRMAARRAVDSMMGPGINQYSKRAVRNEIPAVVAPLVPYGTPPPAAAAPVAPPPEPAVVAPAAAEPPKNCTKDKDCPGDLVCAGGVCKAE
ncbi:MAG: CsgG/HfaB family protein [Proteobacteria bacterium]|jgi:hypothetical protein|nr:CsgG/HfaB family protein [Pseudomonadota bacterium]